MKNKVVIGFEVTTEKKREIEIAANTYKVDKVIVPLTMSQFCRVAVEKLLKEIKV